METAAVDLPVGGKRSAEKDLDETSLQKKKKKKKKKKKVRFDESGGDLKRVAEIVLVLSTLGKIRSGRNPTIGEKKLMVEAREKLVEMCGKFSPKDIVPNDAGKVLIEDLGLNRDKKLGLLLQHKNSISEKFLLAKKKMEDSEKMASQSATYSSQMPKVGVAGKPECCGTPLHTNHRFVPDGSSSTARPVGGFRHITPNVHVPPPSSTASNKLPVNVALPAMVPRRFPISSVVKGSSPVPQPTEATHPKLDGRTTASAYGSQPRDSSGVQILEKASPFSSHYQSEGAIKVGNTNRTLNQSLFNAEKTLQTSLNHVALPMERDQISKPSVDHTTHKNPSSLYDNHNEAVRNVQKFLQQRLLKQPSWTPPSTEYMHKSIACIVCEVAITSVENLLVCDGCEKGIHLECRQSLNQDRIIKAEWHCPKCLISNNGKSLSSKYGRVVRHVIAAKASPSSSGAHGSSEIVAQNPNSEVIHQSRTANGTPILLDPAHAGNTGSNPTSDTKMSSGTGIQMEGDNFSPSRTKMDDCLLPKRNLVPKEVTGVACSLHSENPYECCNNHSQNTESSLCNSKKSSFDDNAFLKCDPSSTCSEKLSDTCPSAHALCNSQDVEQGEVPNCPQVPTDQSLEVNTSDSKENSGCHEIPFSQDNQEVTQDNSVGTLGIGTATRGYTLSDGFHRVDWVGGILQVVDEKAFYSSCRINGVIYKLQDHALFHSKDDNLRPSKIQALWENMKTKSRWATVKHCYMPDDLPEVVERPCTPEANEVYESNHGTTVKAGLIQGSCEVLPPNGYRIERERRLHLAHEADAGLLPIFLCKWFYDESRGVFEPITD